MDLHDGNFDLDGHQIDGGDPLSAHTDPTAHSMIATGYEGPGTEGSLGSGLDDHLDDADLLGGHDDPGSPEDPTAPADQDAMTGAGGGHDIEITINGQQFDGTATLDSDGDGHDDTALVTLNERGNQAAIADLDGDGQADQATLFNPDGDVIDQQHLDASGSWIDDGVSGAPAQDSTGAGHGSSLVGGAIVESPGAEAAATGAAAHSGEPIRMNLHGHEYETTDTRDTDHDGTADTGILPTSDGGEIVVTDTDGDHVADHAQIYDRSGHDRGGIFVTSDGHSTPDGEGQPPAEAEKSSWVIDPTTGDWVSS